MNKFQNENLTNPDNNKKKIEKLFNLLSVVVEKLSKKNKISKAIYIERETEGLFLIRVNSKRNGSKKKSQSHVIEVIESLADIDDEHLSLIKQEMKHVGKNGYADIFLYELCDEVTEKDVNSSYEMVKISSRPEKKVASQKKQADFGPVAKAVIAQAVQTRESNKAYKKQMKAESKKANHKSDDFNFR